MEKVIPLLCFQLTWDTQFRKEMEYKGGAKTRYGLTGTSFPLALGSPPRHSSAPLPPSGSQAVSQKRGKLKSYPAWTDRTRSFMKGLPSLSLLQAPPEQTHSPLGLCKPPLIFLGGRSVITAAGGNNGAGATSPPQ